MLTASTASAAELRPYTSLSSPVVRLSDLFDNLDKTPDRPLGPSPAPGTNIVVEAPQLAAIARQFGVAWRPASLADRALLDRPGRPLSREAAVEALRAALTLAGAAADCDIDLAAYAPPMLAINSFARPDVVQLDFDPNSGRFTALLELASPEMAPVRSRISGQAQEMVEVPVAVRLLPAGTVVATGDLQMARVRARGLHGEPVRLPRQAVGMAVRRQEIAGVPIPLADLVRPAMIDKASTVTMELETPGVSVSAQGIALESGAAGERIRVMNPLSNAVMFGEVVAPGRVRVAAGSTPVPGGRTSAQVAVR